jgi:hemolysin activation/secretion protein
MVAGLTFGFCLAVTSAQVPRTDAPSTRTIQTPEKPPRPVQEEKPRSRRPPGGEKQLLPKLEGVVIVKSETEVKTEGVPVSPGLHVMGIPLLQGEDFKAVVAPYIGQPLSENGLRDLQDDIILYCRSKNRPLIDVILPEQQLENGMLQIWFLEGTVGEVRVNNPMTKWFKDEFIRKQVRVKPGEGVDSVKLTKDIEWLNQNPFRSVDVRFQQGKDVGQSDLVLEVQDRIPVRVYVGYEDTGTRFTGEKRFVTGLNWGNAWGLDHQFNYQYTADTDFDLVSAHSASYFIPLPWRHTITIFGSYVDAKTDFGNFAPGTESDGTSWQVSGRYGVPLPDLVTYRHEVAGGFDFKRADNSLEFIGGSSTNLPLSSSDADVAQFVVAYTGQMADKWGLTSVALEGFYSPGDLTKNNTDEDLGGDPNGAPDEQQGLRPGAQANYVYGRMTAERHTLLPLEFSWFFRGVGQLASERLVPSEQLGGGGYRTVRGYDERVANGDYGFILNNELRTPRLLLGNLLQGTGYASGDYFQALVFFDYARLYYVDQLPEEIEYELMSFGGGLRYSMSSHLAVRFDYGVPLKNKDINRRENGRVHLGIVASF